MASLHPAALNVEVRSGGQEEFPDLPSKFRATGFPGWYRFQISLFFYFFIFYNVRRLLRLPHKRSFHFNRAAAVIRCCSRERFSLV